MWACPSCNEQVNDDFDVCWNCGATCDGTPAPEFSVESIATSEHTPTDVEPLQFGIRHILAVMTVVAVAATLGISWFFQWIGIALFGVVLLTVVGIALWFIFWSFVYLTSGSSALGEQERQDSDVVRSIDTWHARQQVERQLEEGEAP